MRLDSVHFTIEPAAKQAIETQQGNPFSTFGITTCPLKGNKALSCPGATGNNDSLVILGLSECGVLL
ncbi:MAG: hypothetical protein H8D27_07430 [Chlorobium phaeobacteroides]|nr:hypothetical protein [Chlorobium phaeobacteroides]